MCWSKPLLIASGLADEKDINPGDVLFADCDRDGVGSDGVVS
jgi:hypothetical protein